MTDTETVSEAELWFERYNAAIEAGLTDQEATIFATGGSLRELRKLVKAGCPLELLKRIVL